MGPLWQDEYRYARAFEAASAKIIETLIGLKNQLTVLQEKEKAEETSIEDA